LAFHSAPAVLKKVDEFLMRRIFLGSLLVILVCSLPALSADNPEPAPAREKSAAELSPEAQQNLRAYLQLQEQLHSALLAIEQARKDADAAAERNNQAIQQAREESETAARRNAELIGTRLKLIEQTLTNQRDSELAAMQQTNRFMFTTAAIVGGIGFLGMLFTAFCFWRALTRVAQITASLHPLTGLHHTETGLGNSNAFVTLNGPEMSSTRLLGAIERLERRIHDLEHTALLPNSTESHPALREQPTAAAESMSTLMARGQAFLDSHEPAKALDCFDEVIRSEPHHAEALVKKGTALEQLKRLEEAIDCYDKAIASNQTMTVAYLHKGAVYNQLERFSEALECYEQALRTQQKPVNS
jgi:tetratricopeptide (TPR) repeat protein